MYYSYMSAGNISISSGPDLDLSKFGKTSKNALETFELRPPIRAKIRMLVCPFRITKWFRLRNMPAMNTWWDSI